MPAANFKGRFAPRVLKGLKRTTIRPGSRFKVGDRFYGYFGMRTKLCTLLVEGTVTHADPVTILEDRVLLLGNALTASALLALAQGDGFESLAEFLKFFADTYSLPFHGQLVQWVPETVPVREAAHRAVRLRVAMGEVLAGGTKKASSRKRTAARLPKLKKGVEA